MKLIAMRIWINLLFFLVLISNLNAQQISIYVSPSGNDQNIGSLSQPFKTIAKALSIAEKMKGKNAIVQLRGGTYYLNETISLNSNDLLTNTLQISAYKNEPVNISAGRR